MKEKTREKYSGMACQRQEEDGEHPFQVWLSKCPKASEIKAMNANVGEGCKMMVESMNGGRSLDIGQRQRQRRWEWGWGGP